MPGGLEGFFSHREAITVKASPPHLTLTSAPSVKLIGPVGKRRYLQADLKAL